MLELFNYVDGARRPATSNRWLDVWEPATGRVYGRAPNPTRLTSAPRSSLHTTHSPLGATFPRANGHAGCIALQTWSNAI